MSKPLKFKFENELITKAEFYHKMVAFADKFDGRQKTMVLDMMWEDFKEEKMKNKFKTFYAPIMGVIFLVIILIIAFISPFPTKFQTNVYWIFMAIGAAGAAAAIPGFFEFKYQTEVRAGGALAVFCLIYLKSPAVSHIYENESATKMAIYMVNDSLGKDIQFISSGFDKNSGIGVVDYVSNALTEYGTGLPDTAFTCYRKSDGKIYLKESCNQISEYEILVIPNALMRKFPNQRKAYAKAITLTAKLQNDLNGVKP